MNMTALTPPAPSGSDRSFLDEAVASHAERLGRKEANRHKRHDLLAALVLVGIVFSATAAPSLEISSSSKPSWWSPERSSRPLLTDDSRPQHKQLLFSRTGPS